MNSKVIVPIIILLVIASFLVGTAWTKLGITGKTSSLASPSPATGAKTGQQQPKVLGVAEMSSLVKDGVVLGSKDAKVTVVEFSDPSCPYCAAAAGADIKVGEDKDGKPIKIITDALKKRNPAWEAPVPQLEKLAREGKIQLVFRYFPGHGTGEAAMQAAWCGADQNPDLFWNYLNLLFANQENLGDVQLVANLASQAGLDKNKISGCVEAGKYKDRLAKDIQAGKDAAKAYNGEEGLGTPTFFINGQQIVGAQPYEVFAKVINQELGQ